MSTKIEDRRSILARAIDDWLQSDEGRKCQAGVATDQYLRNRLYTAYIAGWNAAKHEVEKLSKAL